MEADRFFSPLDNTTERGMLRVLARYDACIENDLFKSSFYNKYIYIYTLLFPTMIRFKNRIKALLTELEKPLISSYRLG